MGAFALVAALAAFFRLYDLGHGHPGLAIYTSISSHAYKSFHNWLYPNMFADGSILADKPPLFFWYQGLFIALLGPSNLAFRLPVALAGICSVILLYIVVRRTAGTTPALIAAASLAIMPLDVNYARSTFIEPVTTVTLLLTAYFVVRAAQEKREGFYYVAAFVLGLAWMVKLWQGLLPAPAFAMIALMYRWQPWAAFIRTGAIGVGIFLVTAFWWPVVVWLTPSAYDSVMHADSVWDMIFGWNLRERFGDLEYGARHRQDILWFVTGPMAPYFGVSLFPAAAVGVVVVTVALWHKAVAKIASSKPIIALRESRVRAYLSFYTEETGTQTSSHGRKDAEDSISRVTEMGDFVGLVDRAGRSRVRRSEHQAHYLLGCRDARRGSVDGHRHRGRPVAPPKRWSDAVAGLPGRAVGFDLLRTRIWENESRSGGKRGLGRRDCDCGHRRGHFALFPVASL